MQDFRPASQFKPLLVSDSGEKETSQKINIFSGQLLMNTTCSVWRILHIVQLIFTSEALNVVRGIKMLKMSGANRLARLLLSRAPLAVTHGVRTGANLPNRHSFEDRTKTSFVG